MAGSLNSQQDLLPEHRHPVLFLRANDLRFGATRAVIARTTFQAFGISIASADGRAKVGKSAKSHEATNCRRTERAWSVSWLLICASLPVRGVA